MKDIYKHTECIHSILGNEVKGVDCGDEAASWMNTYVNKPANTYRLLYSPPWIEKCKVHQGPSQHHKNATVIDEVFLVIALIYVVDLVDCSNFKWYFLCNAYIILIQFHNLHKIVIDNVVFVKYLGSFPKHDCSHIAE